MPVRRHPTAVSKSRAPLSLVPLDVALAERLRSTYELVRAGGPRFAELFYAKLFKAAPHLRSMFRSDPASQAEKLTAALDAVVANFSDPTGNAEMLSALGKRHAEYGARPQHYDLVIDLLIDAMRETLGPSVGQPALDEWHMALRLISNQMIAAAEE
ncbi:MAG: globin domain-containing protein [Phycisphaerales bacterium]